MNSLNLSSLKFKIFFLSLLTSLLFASSFAQTTNTNILDNFRMEYNGSLTNYFHRNSPTNYDTKTIFIYIVRPRSGSAYLKARFQYSGSIALGVQEYNIIADKYNQYRITPPGNMIQRGSNNRYVYSWCDLDVNPDFFKFLQALIKSEKPRLEYIGTAGNLDVKITRTELKVIEEVLDAYDKLK